MKETSKWTTGVMRRNTRKEFDKMKKSLVLILISSVATLCFGQNERHHAKETPPIDAFGEKGSLVPSFLGSKPNPEFFTLPMTESFASRADYTATFSLTRIRASQNAEPSRGAKTLTLTNLSEAQTAVTVSAMVGPKVRNFLIGIEPWATKTVDMDSLWSFDSLYFVSIQPFEGQVAIKSSYRENSLTDYFFTADVPVRNHANGTSNYCVDIEVDPADPNENGVVLRVRASTSSNYESAWFERKYVGDSEQQCIYWVEPPTYILNVYWPSQSVLHHDGSAHQEVSCLSYSKCVKERYATTSNTNGNKLYWYNYNFWNGTPGTAHTIQSAFDELLFHSGCGVVACQDGSGTGGCSVNPNGIWYVYNPSVTCP